MSYVLPLATSLRRICRSLSLYINCLPTESVKTKVISALPDPSDLSSWLNPAIITLDFSPLDNVMDLV